MVTKSPPRFDWRCHLKQTLNGVREQTPQNIGSLSLVIHDKPGVEKLSTILASSPRLCLEALALRSQYWWNVYYLNRFLGFGGESWFSTEERGIFAQVQSLEFIVDMGMRELSALLEWFPRLLSLTVILYKSDSAPVSSPEASSVFRSMKRSADCPYLDLRFKVMFGYTDLTRHGTLLEDFLTIEGVRKLAVQADLSTISGWNPQTPRTAFPLTSQA